MQSKTFMNDHSSFYPHRWPSWAHSWNTVFCDIQWLYYLSAVNGQEEHCQGQELEFSLPKCLCASVPHRNLVIVPSPCPDTCLQQCPFSSLKCSPHFLALIAPPKEEFFCLLNRNAWSYLDFHKCWEGGCVQTSLRQKQTKALPSGMAKLRIQRTEYK